MAEFRPLCVRAITTTGPALPARCSASGCPISADANRSPCSPLASRSRSNPDGPKVAPTVLTNAMKPMDKMKPALLRRRERFGDHLTLRVSIDHYGCAVHELERGKRSWAPTIDGLVWLAENGFSINVASRYLSGEPEAVLRRGFTQLFAKLGIALDADDPVALMIFPEMDATVDVPEITEACWGILSKSPESVMCATSRMVVKHKGAVQPSVIACTLLPYDPLWDLGHSLAGASGAVSLNHPHCANSAYSAGLRAAEPDPPLGAVPKRRQSQSPALRLHYSSGRPSRCHPSVPPRSTATSCKPMASSFVAAWADRRSVLQTSTTGCRRAASSPIRPGRSVSGTLTAPGRWPGGAINSSA
jgi:hypothetical protein